MEMTSLFHLTILIKKRDDLTYAQFHEYWSTSHPKIWLGVPIVQENVVKYSQFHVNQDLVSALKNHPGLEDRFAEYDGGVEIWTNSVEDAMAVFADEDYLRLVVPDEEKFLKRAEAKMMVGFDEVKWLEGKAV